MSIVDSDRNHRSSVLREDLLRSVRLIAPVLRSDADKAELNSRLTDESATALRDAGLFRLGVPLRFGGYEADAVTAIEVLAELAQACPSSAWVSMISYGAQQAVGAGDEQVRQDIWADGPDTSMCGAFHADAASTESVDGGIAVSGRWSWVSGCHHADWALLTVPPATVATNVPRAAVMPLADLTIEKTWDMAGMRGTGSDTVVADGVFIPQHRIRSFADVVTGARDADAPPLYRIPLGPLTVVMVAPLLGAVREVLRQTMAIVDSGKPMAMTNYPRLADSPSVQTALADAANLVDSAHLHLIRSAHFLDASAAASAEPTPVGLGRVRMDMAHASTCLREAMHLLLTVGGASGFRSSSVVSRFWRDVETGARHPNLNTGMHREIYGRALVGNREPVGPI